MIKSHIMQERSSEGEKSTTSQPLPSKQEVAQLQRFVNYFEKLRVAGRRGVGDDHAATRAPAGHGAQGLLPAGKGAAHRAANERRAAPPRGAAAGARAAARAFLLLPLIAL